jgi:hypothetical protein
MSIKLQLRRGLETDLPTLAAGEPGFCTDTYKLFIGSAAGNKGVAMLASPTFTDILNQPTLKVQTGLIKLLSDPNNPVLADAAEMSLIMDGATQLDMFYAKNSDLFRLYYTYATDSSCHTFAAPVATDLTTCRFPFVMKNGSTYYAFGTHLDSKVYLYSSTDKLHWTAMNGGNPVLTGIGGECIANVGVVVVGTTWHMYIEAWPSSGYGDIGLYYSYSTLADMNWDTHRTPTQIIPSGVGPEPVYVPDRNAILLLHGLNNAIGNRCDAVAHYVSLSDNPALATSYHLAPGFFQHRPGLFTDNHSFVVAGSGKDHNIIISEYYGEPVGSENQIWFMYSDLSLNDFYDAAVGNIATAVNYAAISNAPTGKGPELKALGADEDIDLILSPKGDGVVRVDKIDQISPYGLRLNNLSIRVNPLTNVVSLFPENIGTSVADLHLSSRYDYTTFPQVGYPASPGIVLKSTGGVIISGRSGCGTFSGYHGGSDPARVPLVIGEGAQGFTGLMISSIANNAQYPNYGLIMVNGTTIADYDTWAILHDGPANSGGGLYFAYAHNGTNILDIVGHPEYIKMKIGKDGSLIFPGPLELGPLGRSLKTWWNFEDFIGWNITSGVGIWTPYVSGTAAFAHDIASTSLRPGIISLSTGTTTTGFVYIVAGQWTTCPLYLGAGVYTAEMDIYLPALSTAAETYVIRLGFGYYYTGDFAHGAYFEYTDVGGGTPTPNWYKCTASNSTRTKTDTTIAVVAGAWMRLKVVINAAATSVEYFINGTSVGILTTNIPTGAVSSFIMDINKIAGTTARAIWTDWAWAHFDLATSR